MKTELSVVTAFAGTLLLTCLLTGSAEATSMPVLNGGSAPGPVTLVRGHGGGHGGGHGMRGGGRAMAHAYRGGGRAYAYRGGRYHAYRGRRYAYNNYYYRHRHYGHYGRYHRRYYGWYGWPYVSLSYGYYGGGCGWLYRNAVATGSPYWWNRYYTCIGY